MNCSFRTGCFPCELKIAKVSPIYKGGFDDIGINKFFQKIFEKTVY